MPGLRWRLFLAGVLCALSASFALAQDMAHDGYVGSGSCVQCHAAESTAWAGSDHAWALKAPDAASMLGDFNDASITNKNVTTRFTTKDGKYFVETEGADGKPQSYEVRYAVGHRPLQQYLVETEKGRLQALDLVWDVTQKKWFHLYPDQDAPPCDGLHWTGSYKTGRRAAPPATRPGSTRAMTLRPALTRATGPS